MTTTPTPADELRTAAEKLRVLSATATPGPWRSHDTHLGQYGHAATVLSGEGNDTDLRAWLPSMSQQPWDEARNVWADASYIAAMHPVVGAALARLLERVNVEMTEAGGFAASAVDGPMDDRDHNTWSAALAVARLINGSQP
ncbi:MULTISPECIES: hypothetical protein [unclassified Streptomyces]|uniref:hypothetical protein n=1 Tax=unclassified Streptomyces TaxID=2593676 RepID=UPI00340630AE